MSKTISSLCLLLLVLNFGSLFNLWFLVACGLLLLFDMLWFLYLFCFLIHYFLFLLMYSRGGNRINLFHLLSLRLNNCLYNCLNFLWLNDFNLLDFFFCFNNFRLLNFIKSSLSITSRSCTTLGLGSWLGSTSVVTFSLIFLLKWDKRHAISLIRK